MNISNTDSLNSKSLNIPHITNQIQDAKDTLARIIGFVGNCDTKSGMVLAISGVLALIGANSGVVTMIFRIFENIASINLFPASIFTLCILLSLYFYVYGVYSVSLAITANVVCSGKMLRTYFADIAESKLENYKTTFIQNSYEEILDDLLEQIHVNATICTRKYKHYNTGLRSIIRSICLFLPTVCFGFFAL